MRSKEWEKIRALEDAKAPTPRCARNAPWSPRDPSTGTVGSGGPIEKGKVKLHGSVPPAYNAGVRITMVKKRLANGDPCEKCAQTEEMLKRRGLWERIDEVLWAIEGEDDSPGAQVAAEYGVKLAPFFVVQDESGAQTVVTSALQLVRNHLDGAPAVEPPARTTGVDPAAATKELANAEPLEILRFGLERYGERCAIAFSGAEDVALIDMATSLGLPFSVLTVDTARLHGETYEFFDEVRRRYGCGIEVVLPDGEEISDLVSRKGPNSFHRDGRGECCTIRKLRPLARALGRFDAWVTGQTGDSPATLPVVQADPSFQGASGTLLRINPLARWNRDKVFEYLSRHGAPTNPLHGSSFARIDCAPCMRARGGSAAVAEHSGPDLGDGI